MAGIETETETEIESETESETESAMETEREMESNSNGNTFTIDDEFIREEKRKCIERHGEEKWRKEGQISLSCNIGYIQKISHVIVDVDEDLAREVKSLNLNYNPVTIMEPEENVKKFSQLRKLDCSNCKLTAFPAWIFSLTTIEGVDFSNNSLPDIPPQISAFTSLKTISLEINKLRKLPSFLMELDSLEKVSAHYNEIEEVESVGRVRQLLLYGNERLKTIPTGIHLTYVQIIACDIRRLPDDFFRFNLETLKISGNKGKEMKMG